MMMTGTGGIAVDVAVVPPIGAGRGDAETMTGLGIAEGVAAGEGHVEAVMTMIGGKDGIRMANSRGGAATRIGRRDSAGTASGRDGAVAHIGRNDGPGMINSQHNLPSKRNSGAGTIRAACALKIPMIVGDDWRRRETRSNT
jgi:hypothetical protein